MTKKLKNIKIIKFNEAYNKILYLFYSFPNASFSLNEISKQLNLSKTNVKKIILLLQKEEFLNIKVFGKTWNISCNIKHRYNYTKKISYNLEMIYDAYYSFIQNEILSLVGNFNCVILFGSYRKGDDNEKSDIDIAVEISNKINEKIVNIGVIPNFGFRKNVNVNIHFFSKKDLDINLFTNIANGIIIEGFLEVRP